MSFFDLFKRPDINRGVEESNKVSGAPLFAYCHSGSRSSQAAAMLRHMGYTNVKNIGGIAGYTGKVAV